MIFLFAFFYLASNNCGLEAINIRTTHNLVISYPKATLGLRIGAFFIDFMIVFFLFVGVLSFVSDETLSIIISTVLFFLYHISFEILMMGQSPGKKAVGIRVVSIDGSSPSIKAYLIRWCFRFVDIGVSSGFLAMASIYSSDRGQRLGDLLAGTTVVKIRASQIQSFENITKLNKLNREIKYPLLRQYTDEDMIMIKTLLQRTSNEVSPENGEKIRNIVKKLVYDLGVDKASIKNPRIFLNEVLEDYIIQTR